MKYIRKNIRLLDQIFTPYTFTLQRLMKKGRLEVFNNRVDVKLQRRYFCIFVVLI